MFLARRVSACHQDLSTATNRTITGKHSRSEHLTECSGRCFTPCWLVKTHNNDLCFQLLVNINQCSKPLSDKMLIQGVHMLKLQAPAMLHNDHQTKLTHWHVFLWQIMQHSYLKFHVHVQGHLYYKFIMGNHWPENIPILIVIDIPNFICFYHLTL